MAWQDPPHAGPLSGLKVLELAHVMAGPTCGRTLADLGADVIKLERLDGEDCRRMAPPWQGDEAAGFLMLNRNKHGISIDLKRPEGLKIALDLIGKADVLIENFRMGTMERLGLGYDELQRTNPKLIYCAISGFGRSGPYAHKGGFDVVAQAMSGILSVTGEGQEGPPVKAGVPVGDIGAGLYATIGILAALAERQRTGQGQKVETSLFEAAASFMTWPVASYFASGEIARPMGTAHPLDAPYQAFKANDGWFVVGAANQANWLRLTKAIDAAHLAEDPRYKENPDRVKNLEALVQELSSIFAEESKSHWIAALDSAGVPTGPINNVEDMLADPQLNARGMVMSAPHETLGAVKTLGLPIHFSGSEVMIRKGAPLLGTDTRQILADMGYTSQEIEQLVVDKVVRTPNS
ncbi:MAG: CoA transferase [Pseudomonadota bacterium]